MTIKPTIVYQSTTGHDQLSVWPAIPGITGPVIQIDHGKKIHTVVGFNKEDAPALAAAILVAAAESD